MCSLYVSVPVIELNTSKLNSCLTLISAFQAVPSTSVTADKFMASFLGIGYSRITKRSNWNEDIVAVIDGSGSIGRCEFDKGKMALVNLMGKMNNPMFDTKYAAVTYSSSAKANFKFSPRSTAASKIKNVVYPGGSTNTEAGLAEAKKLLFEDPLSGTMLVNSREAINAMYDVYISVP